MFKLCASHIKSIRYCDVVGIWFCWRWGEQATHLRWDTLIISMGGSSFPRSPLNAKHLPENTTDIERENVSVWWWKAEDGIFPYTCEETDWSHFILVPGRPGFISFAGAKRANCRQLILTTCSNSCFSFRKLSTRRSRHYAEHQGAPLNKTRIPFRCILSHLPKEVLIWFPLRTLWKMACLKCTSDRAACSGLRRGRGWPPTILFRRQWVCTRGDEITEHEV